MEIGQNIASDSENGSNFKKSYHTKQISGLVSGHSRNIWKRKGKTKVELVEGISARCVPRLLLLRWSHSARCDIPKNLRSAINLWGGNLLLSRSHAIKDGSYS